MKPIKKIGVHDSCRHKTHLDGLSVCCPFEGNVKTLITDVKYSLYFDEAKTLGVLTASYLRRSRALEQMKPRVVIPIPLTREKELERGFNQCSLICVIISDVFRIPTTQSLLKKIRTTSSQVGLAASARRKNLTDAFHCSVRLQENDSILLVDDVVTTGATLSECARTLKKAGAGKVYGLAIAHGH